jgi:hypothetical protein
VAFWETHQGITQDAHVDHMVCDGCAGDEEYDRVYNIILTEVQQYVRESRGDPDEDFNLEIPLMDAGLDSLDLLKVSLHQLDDKPPS